MKVEECRGSGYYVITKTGRKGRTLNKTRFIGGKVVVYLYQKDYDIMKPETCKFETDAETGEVKTLLCVPDTVTVKGFID